MRENCVSSTHYTKKKIYSHLLVVLNCYIFKTRNKLKHCVRVGKLFNKKKIKEIQIIYCSSFSSTFKKKKNL